MLSAILSFLGGSVFRMLWGEISAWLTAKQGHAHEIERMRLQMEVDAAAFERNQAGLKLQSELQIKTIAVQSEAAVATIEATGWLEAVKATAIITGIRWVDGWNASIRPGVATWSVLMLTAEAAGTLKLNEGCASVCFAALGLYLADRSLQKRGK